MIENGTETVIAWEIEKVRYLVDHGPFRAQRHHHFRPANVYSVIFRNTYLFYLISIEQSLKITQM